MLLMAKSTQAIVSMRIFKRRLLCNSVQLLRSNQKSLVTVAIGITNVGPFHHSFSNAWAVNVCRALRVGFELKYVNTTREQLICAQ